ncbi:hypothetical protein OSTOST_00439, partial [Ostertagia ostertagi]
MPRNNRLSMDEQAEIDVMRDLGWSVRRMSQRIDRSRDCIARYLRNPLAYNTKTLTGRPKKLSERDRRSILRLASNSTKTASEIREELGLQTCSRLRFGYLIKGTAKEYTARQDHKTRDVDEQWYGVYCLLTMKETREYVIEDVDKPLFERSSPIEEWSSDSRDSPLLEMSRYDNVPCTGQSSRVLLQHSSSHVEALPRPWSGQDKVDHSEMKAGIKEVVIPRLARITT